MGWKNKIDFKVSRGTPVITGKKPVSGNKKPVSGNSNSPVVTKKKSFLTKIKEMLAKNPGRRNNTAHALPYLWQIDLVGILLTVVGCAYIFMHLEQVEAVILYAVYQLLNLMGLILVIGGLILGAYLMFFGRRRRW